MACGFFNPLLAWINPFKLLEMNQNNLEDSNRTSGGNVEIFGQYWFTRKKNLYWICQLLGWGAFCSLFIINNLRNFDIATLLPDTLTTTVGLCFLSHLFRGMIHRLQWLKLYFSQLLPRVIIASFVLSLLAIPIQITSSWIYNYDLLIEYLPEFDSSSFDSILLYLQALSQLDLIGFISALLEGSLFFLFWQVAYFLYHHVNNYNKNLRLEASVNEFQLNQLRSQLNPHFIFNALNSVKALVDEDPDRAKDSIFQLSNILRNSLVMDKKKVITFEEELEIVQNYLALEGTRFEERLQVSYDLDPKSMSYKVPPMMLQTIVENGIKHGISKRKNGGYVHIKTYVAEEKLVIEIRNTGKYEPHTSTSKTGGYGLKSTKQRLELLYDKDAQFIIGNSEKEEEVLTKLVIPIWQKRESNEVANVA